MPNSPERSQKRRREDRRTDMTENINVNSPMRRVKTYIKCKWTEYCHQRAVSVRGLCTGMWIHTHTQALTRPALCHHRSALYTHTQTGPFLHCSKPSTVAGSLDLWSACIRSTRGCGGVEDAGLASRLTEREELVWWERWPGPELLHPRSCY